MIISTKSYRAKQFGILSLAAQAAFAFLPSGAYSAQATTSRSYNPTNSAPAAPEALPSVSVGADHRATFRIRAPEARTVKVNGDFLMGAPAAALTKGDDGTWTFTSPPLTPDSYTYNFTVEGLMVLDT